MKISTVPAKKPGSFDNRLALYGLVAGATLAGASQTDAMLITLDLTGLAPATRTTPVGGSLYFDVNAVTAAAAVGGAAFAGADFFLSNAPMASTKANVTRSGTVNGVAGTAIKADRFAQGDTVGPANIFNTRGKIGSRYGTSSGTGTAGNFASGDTGYLGLRFAIGGPADLHYGWANITLNSDYTVTLNAVGYESDANTPAAVPEPSAIALLVAGALGVVAFRRRAHKAA
jgi:hypothetical protein